MKYCILFFICWVSLNTVHAQELNNYNGLYSSTRLPDAVVESTFLKYDEEISGEVTKDDSRLNRKAKKKFLLTSNYLLDELLSSGKIVFNDTVSRYLNAIKDRLLKDQPDLRKKIQVFTFKSPVVNALATSHGVLFMTTGLLARLHTEAELAFVLSHEIQHYLKNHGIDAYVEQVNLVKTDRSFKKLSLDEKFKLLSAKSREDEMEADEGGLELFFKSGYDFKAPAGVFNVLRESAYPYEKIPYDPSFFKIQGTDIPEACIVETDFGVNEAEPDTDIVYSTHPAIDDRIAMVEAKIDKSKPDPGKGFIVSEDWFELTRKISRLENVKQLADIKVYDAALYYCFLASADMADVKYLNLLKVRILYEFSKEVVKHGSGNLTTTYGFDAGKIKEHDLVMLALLHCRQALARYPDNMYLAKVETELIREMAQYNLKEIKEKSIYPGAIEKLSASAEFLRETGDGKEKAKKSLAVPKAAAANREDYLKGLRKEGLGIDTLVLIEPQWNLYDTRNGTHFINNEKKTADYIQILKENAGITGLELTPLSVKQMKTADVAAFNDLVLLKEYFAYLLSGSDNLVFFETERLHDLMAKYNTTHVGFMGINSLIVKRHWLMTAMYIYGTITVIGAPLTLYKLFTVDYNTSLYSVVLDLEATKVDFYDEFIMKSKAKDWYVKSRTYDYFKIFK